MARPQPYVSLTVGDPMPRITLPSAAGTLFDSTDPVTWGLATAYWLGEPPGGGLVEALAACETMLHVVAPAPPDGRCRYPSWLLDLGGELARAFGATGRLAILVDAAGRVAALLPEPTADSVAVAASQLHRSSRPEIVPSQAPVLCIERVVEPAVCRTLIEFWQRGRKVVDRVGSAAGNVVNAGVKRRQDVQVDDPRLFMQLRDCLARRVVPAIEQAFHARINVIEAPIVGCYDSACGGWFRRHRDNTSVHTAHRQFALSANLNGEDEYDGGELRFAEYGRQLYRPALGGALVFSSSLLHEVMPVSRGRRFGVFTFLSASGPSFAQAALSSRATSRSRCIP